MKKNLFSVLAVSALFTACKKDNDNNATAQSRLLGKWAMTANRSTVTFNGVTGSQDNFTNLEACEKDDRYIFNADNTVTQENSDGTTNNVKCRSSDPATQSYGTWALLNNDTRLKINLDTFEIIRLTSSDMQLRQAYITSTGSTVDSLTFSKR